MTSGCFCFSAVTAAFPKDVLLFFAYCSLDPPAAVVSSAAGKGVVGVGLGDWDRLRLGRDGSEGVDEVPVVDETVVPDGDEHEPAGTTSGKNVDPA